MTEFVIFGPNDRVLTKVYKWALGDYESERDEFIATIKKNKF